MTKWPFAVLTFLLAVSAACAQPFHGKSVAIAKDGKGIGFDDLRYSPSLHRVLVPAGRTGEIALVDPATLHVTTIGGLSAESRYGGGHGEGTTSVDEGGGALFAIDRTAQQLVAIDLEKREVKARTALSASPDYVRFVAPGREVWVTEPDAERIEVFRVSPNSDALTRVLAIPVPGGPESLVIDADHGRAFTHLWSGRTVVINIGSHAIAADWGNRCGGSRGIAYDATSQFVFAGCAEGKVVVIDAGHGGIVRSTASAGRGVDIIDYDPVRRRLYVPGARSATLSIFSVGLDGSLKLLSTHPVVHGAHCVTTDGRTAFVCDPDGGRILVIPDK